MNPIFPPRNLLRAHNAFSALAIAAKNTGTISTG